ncbi:MAG: NusG domain II-containing protein [Clostridia bacterium]|nr:NusG domain II-containing protein [Clostridia bacterium]
MNQTKQVPTAHRGGRTFRNDLIFIGVLLLVVALLGLAFFFLRGEGNTVTVTVDGELFGTYSLSEDTTVEIRTGDDGEELNLLIIRDGVAYVETATCPDGICAAHKPISRDGESIVCLPHKVVITVTAVDDSEQPDIVA